MLDWIDEMMAERKRDRKRLEEADPDLCMICHAYGVDKRSLFVDCSYQMKEAVPEMLDLSACDEPLNERGYYLRICKSCRGSLLGHMRIWANERRATRNEAKSGDGGELILDESEWLVPVRLDGATVYMTEEQYLSWRAR